MDRAVADREGADPFPRGHCEGDGHERGGGGERQAGAGELEDRERDADRDGDVEAPAQRRIRRAREPDPAPVRRQDVKEFVHYFFWSSRCFPSWSSPFGSAATFFSIAVISRRSAVVGARKMMRTGVPGRGRSM